MLEALVVPAHIGLFSTWLLGLSVGLTACTVVCLPFMGTWVIGTGRGGATAFYHAALFAGGKVVAYGLLGLLAAVLGEWLEATLAGGFGNLVIGLSSIAAAAWLLLATRPVATCATARNGAGLPPFVLGIALSLTPCAPLAALLVAAALAGDPWLGLGYGVSFGLGAAVTPFLLIAPLLGAVGSGMIQGRPWLGRALRLGAALVLVGLGVRRLLAGP
jgi:hypothetical protein